ncbi:MAG: ATP synthase F1 subunit delta [Omnitrophica bacterium RIFCSPHIGHO2_02_FULL_51_18]|nr:MAG: ATP synthase F1 subunit delta [Omnitrophica bacterium RIFCSPHIGHO2_02_FULL_51_18]
MDELIIADRYAKALFEIVQPLGEDEVVEEELLSFSAALKSSPELEKFFGNPHFSIEDKVKTLRGLYKKSAGKTQDTLVRFFEVLFKKHRFYLVHDITALYKKIADESQKETALVIQSAVPLSVAAEQQIVSQMERIAQAKVEVKKELNPSMIGGITVRFRNKVLDGSVKNMIQLFRKELTKIGSI